MMITEKSATRKNDSKHETMINNKDKGYILLCFKGWTIQCYVSNTSSIDFLFSLQCVRQTAVSAVSVENVEASVDGLNRS